VPLQLSQDPDADALLDRDPLAHLIGMLLDQQIPMEHAFWAPSELARRLGSHTLDAHVIATHDPDALVALFATPRALHRYPKAMAGRVQALCAALVETYDGDVTLVWRDVADGKELYSRLVALPGFVCVIPGSGEITIAPVSVCHHVSTIGQRFPPMCSRYHIHASGLIGSPTEPSRRRRDKSCLAGYSSPHFMNARIAVGAV